MDFFIKNETIAPNAPDVISETIDGEAIIMHHGTGHYFNSMGAGGTIWEAIEQGATLEQIVAKVVDSYEVSENDARLAARRFLESLAGHGLITLQETPGAASHAKVAARKTSESRAPFSEPELGVHTDLSDMLLLDPIHDVDEQGWPSRSWTKESATE